MKMKLFELERVQSLFENTVEYNLTESGFHPLTLKDMLSPEQIDDLARLTLGYGQTNGSVGLRERIASLYPGQGAGNVLVTNGSSEANFVVCHALLEKGDEVLMMVPNYMQIWGVVEEMGTVPRPFHLREENHWAPDLDELERAVGPRTRMIAVCNPNNPTGYVLTDEEMGRIARIADRAGAWVHMDEVYRGAELSGEETPSFVGLYPRTTVTCGLSKAYALPGLRLGWLVGPARIIEQAWAYHDYTSITAGLLSEQIAQVVLSPEVRPGILERNRTMLRENLREVRAWVDSFGGRLHLCPPQAGGIAFLRYDWDIGSTELSDWLREQYSVFVLAGDTFGMDRYFRIGIGAEKPYLKAGLERIRDAVQQRFGV